MTDNPMCPDCGSFSTKRHNRYSAHCDYCNKDFHLLSDREIRENMKTLKDAFDWLKTINCVHHDKGNKHFCMRATVRIFSPIDPKLQERFGKDYRGFYQAQLDGTKGYCTYVCDRVTCENYEEVSA